MAYIGKRPTDSFPVNNAITSTLIAANAVGASEIANGAVGIAELATNAVTSAKLAQNSVLTKHIDDAQITTGHIIDANVTTAKLADDAVTAAKITDNAVGAAALNISGNGTSGQAVLSDGDGSFSYGSSGKTTEEIQDIAGAMFSSNTETNITATYEDGDGTIDLVVGTLNQDTTGNAATATALETARTIGGTSFDGTANIAVNLAATATALASARTIHGVSFDGTANIDLSEVVQDTAGAMFSSNTETNITATYEDSDGTIDLVAEQQLNNTSAPYYHKVVVTVVSDGGNKYALDGGTQAIAKVTPNVVYRFDQSDSSNSGHPFRFGTAANGSEISAGYTIYNKVGSPGSAGAYTEVAFEQDAPGLLYYFCSSHSGMGAQVAVASEATLTQTLTNKTLTSPNITGLSLGGTAITATAAELNLMDGGTSGTSTTLVNADRVIINDAGTMKQVELSDLATYMGDNVTINQTQSALTVSGNTTIGGNLTVNGTTTTVATSNMVVSDNLIELNNGASSNANDSGIVIERGSTGDNAVFVWDESADKFIVGTTTATGASTGNLTITTGTLVGNIEGNVTGNVTGNVSGTAATVTTAAQTNITSLGTLTALTVDNVVIDGAVIGHTGDTDLITLSSGVVTVAGELDAVSLDISGNADIDGTLEADAITIGGVTLAETISDTVGAMVSSNTESGIAVTYDDSDNTLDFTVGTLNQNTTGSAATLTTARAIAVAGDVTGTANFDGSAAISITTALAANTVDSAELVDGSIDTSHIADDQITQAKIADDAVGADQLAANSVVSASIVNGSIVAADLADNSITSAKIVNGTIVAADIANNAILTQHIDDNQITGDQLADDLVLSGTGAIRMPDGTTAQRPGSAAAGMFRYNTTLGKFEGYTDAWGEIGGGGSNTFARQAFTGDGSETDFTLSQTPDSENNLIVFIEGVFQDQDAYSVSGTTLTFGTAPVNGRGIIVYHVKSAVSGTNLSHNQFTANGSATQFTLSITPVHENNTMVYIDGVYQNKTSYSVSGTTLDFGGSFPPPSGSTVECMTMNQLDINVPVDDTISTAKLQSSAVTEAKIAVNAVTSLKIAENAITARELATNAIATLFIADNSVTSVKIAQNSILTKHIDDDQIVTSHILDANVTTAKIADNAVTAAKIGVDVLTDQVAGITSAATPGSACLTIDSNEHATFANNLAVTGQQTTTGGAVSAPSYSFIGDTDTGISRPTTNAVNIVTAGAERVRVSATGKLGIGSSPNNLTDEIVTITTPSSGGGQGLAFKRLDSNSDQVVGTLRYSNNSTDDLAKIIGKTDGANTSSRLTLQTNTGSGLVDTIVARSNGYVEMAGATDVRLTLGSEGTPGTNDANWVRGEGANHGHNTPGDYYWEVSGNKVMRLDADGLRFGTDTATANALDDYEEGTWNPTLIAGTTNPTGGAYQARNGTFTKIGNRVFCTFYVGISYTNTPGGGIYMGNLPYTVSNVQEAATHFPIVSYKLDINGVGAFGVALQNQSNVQIYVMANANAWAALSWSSHTTSPLYIAGEFSYITG